MTDSSMVGTFEYFCEEIGRFRELMQSQEFWGWNTKKQAMALWGLQYLQISLWNQEDVNGDLAYLMLVTHVDEYWTRKRLERLRWRMSDD